MGFFGSGPEKEKAPERITFAAYKWKGEVFSAPNAFHADAFAEVLKRFPGTDWSNKEEREAAGWMTSRGRFVSRKEALLVGTNARQVDFTHVQSEELYSSDLKKEKTE